MAGGGETAEEIERPKRGENRTFVLFQRDSAQEQPHRLWPSACPVIADGGKRMESRLKATMKADDDNSPGPCQVRPGSFCQERCRSSSPLLSYLPFLSSSSSQVKKEIDGSDGLVWSGPDV